MACELWSFAPKTLNEASKHLSLHLMKYFKDWIEYFIKDYWENYGSLSSRSSCLFCICGNTRALGTQSMEFFPV